MNNIFIVLVSIILVSCGEPSNIRTDSDETKSIFLIKKNYRIDQCIALMKLRWEDSLTLEKRQKVIDVFGDRINFTISNVHINGYPMFSTSIVSNNSEVLFYYADRCENRIEITKKILKDTSVTKIPNFPKYELKIGNLNELVGYPLPSGWWKESDQK